uniref:Uncharacterized protein n=1 Tax=Strigamia maritima TaxID=126957 RepID=T1J9X9_STRMM
MASSHYRSHVLCAGFVLFLVSNFPRTLAEGVSNLDSKMVLTQIAHFISSWGKYEWDIFLLHGEKVRDDLYELALGPLFLSVRKELPLKGK